MERNRNRVTIEATFEVNLPDGMTPNSFLSRLGRKIVLCISYFALFVPRTTAFVINVEYRNHQNPSRHRIQVLIRRNGVPRRLRIRMDPGNAPPRREPPRRTVGQSK